MSILDFHGRNQDKAVYVGVSAGSMMVTHSLHVNPEELKATGRYHDDEYNTVAPPNAGSDKTLGLVDFVIRPHDIDSYHA
jgi:peptidase E